MKNPKSASTGRVEPTAVLPRKLGTTLLTLLLLAPALAGLEGCASSPDMAEDAVVEEGPLGGAAMRQRKHDLDRTYRDMLHFHTTMQSLIDRHDSRSLASFERFVDIYMGTHLEPLLRSQWQSTSPELMARDASARFIQAELLIMMRYPRRVQQVRNEIERRYEGQSQLLIEYPIGKQGSLEKGLAILSERKWRG
jgi:hypothetical protein